jgi:hypothetical protein
MYKIITIILFCLTIVFSVVAYDTVFRLTKENQDLHLQIDGYKLLLQQQEYGSIATERKAKIYREKLIEFLYLCQQGRLVKIDKTQYRCYVTYNM